MSERLEQLAIDLAASPRWEWRPGMRWKVPGAHGRIIGDDYIRYSYRKGGEAMARSERPMMGGMGGNRVESVPPDAVPDLNDPATCGVLMAMLWEIDQSTDLETVINEANGALLMFQAWCSDVWCGGGATPGEALADALLKAWS